MGPLLTDETLLAKLVRDSPLAVAASTLADGHILDVNDSFLRLFGYANDEVIGQTSTGLGMWVDPAQRTELLGALMEGQPLRDYEVTVRTKSGSERQVLATVSEVQFEGQACMLTQMYDITDYRQTEIRFRTLVEQLPMITYVHGLEDPRTLTYMSPQVETMLGYSPAEVLAGQPNSLIGRVHPEDREDLLTAAEETLRTLSPYRVEYRAQAADGRWVWLQDQASVVRNEQGRPLLWHGALIDITERKQAEEALRGAEARFRALVQNSSDITVVLDAAGTRAYVSPASERLLGFPASDLVGRGPDDIVHPDDVPKLRDAIELFQRGARETGIIELRLRHHDGSWRHFEAIGTNLLDEPSVAGIVFNSRDITGWKAAQTALRESEERFRSAFSHAPIGISMITPDGRFIQVNSALCELVGYSEQELLGKTVQEITHPDDIADNLELLKRLWSGEIDSYQLEERYLHKDGHIIWVLMTGSSVREGGVARYSIAQVLDITGRRRLEMERAVMLASEREYSRQLRDLTEMRADLTAMIAHELRGPVAALRVMTYLLADGELPPRDQEEMFSAVKGEIAQLDRLVNDMTAVTDAEREDFSVQLHPVPLRVLLESAAAFARTSLGEHPFSISEVPEVRVWCDLERTSQVLRNLLDNTGKHTPSGTLVELRVHHDGNQVRIEVADHGPGLPGEDMGLIFEKFGRGHQAAARQVPGAGLGLYLSRQIIQAQGSDLTVESTPGEGTVFAFELETVS